MKLKDIAQLEFSTVFFDTLFGLILFFGLDSFLEIKSAPHFIFYLLATVIVIHWWLLFKSADDAFSDEVTDSAVDLVFGIVDIILIDYIILLAKTPDYSGATGFIIALLSFDLLWALAWRYLGKWHSKDETRITKMETELDRTIIINCVGIALFALLLYSAPIFTETTYVSLVVVFYFIYILLSFRTKVINLRIF